MNIKILAEDHVSAGRQIIASLLNELNKALAENEALRRQLMTVDYLDVTPEPGITSPLDDDTKHA
jgi:hypothetical protein